MKLLLSLPFLHALFVAFGINIEILLAATFLAAVEYGVITAILLGFFFGLFEDALLGQPLGASSILKVLTGYLLARAKQLIYMEGFLRKLLAATFAFCIYMLIEYILFYTLLNKTWTTTFKAASFWVGKNLFVFAILLLLLRPTPWKSFS
jgi:rod shape-determining protein MreD